MSSWFSRAGKWGFGTPTAELTANTGQNSGDDGVKAVGGPSGGDSSGVRTEVAALKNDVSGAIASHNTVGSHNTTEDFISFYKSSVSGISAGELTKMEFVKLKQEEVRAAAKTEKALQTTEQVRIQAAERRQEARIQSDERRFTTQVIAGALFATTIAAIGITHRRGLLPASSALKASAVVFLPISQTPHKQDSWGVGKFHPVQHQRFK